MEERFFSEAFKNMKSETLDFWKEYCGGSLSDCFITDCGLKVLWSKGDVPHEIGANDISCYSEGGVPCGLPEKSECYGVVRNGGRLFAVTVRPAFESNKEICGYIIKIVKPFELFGGSLVSGKSVAQIRQNVSGILANSTALRNRLEDKELYDECDFIKGTVSSCYQLLSGVTNAGQINRFFSGSLRKTTSDASAFLQNIVDVCRFYLGDSAEIQAEIEPEIVFTADFDKLSAASVNLIVNSFMYNLSEEKRIFVSFKKQNGEAVLTVRDNGTGIPAEYTGSVFGKAAVPEECESSEGLGLAVVKLFAESMGGSVGFMKNVETDGSTVVLKLPITVDADTSLKSEPSEYIQNRFSSLYLTLAKAVRMN